MRAMELSEDEAKYLVLDRLLHPELSFAPQSGDEDANDDARALELLEEAHSSAGMDATVGLNQGDEYIRLVGLVRTDDINRANQVSSQNVASARISYAGRGVLNDSNSAGWLTRFFTHPLFPL